MASTFQIKTVHNPKAVITRIFDTRFISKILKDIKSARVKNGIDGKVGVTLEIIPAQFIDGIPQYMELTALTDNESIWMLRNQLYNSFVSINFNYKGPGKTSVINIKMDFTFVKKLDKTVQKFIIEYYKDFYKSIEFRINQVKSKK